MSPGVLLVSDTRQHSLVAWVPISIGVGVGLAERARGHPLRGRSQTRPYFAQTRPYLLAPIWLQGESAVMTKSIEDILVRIHDDPDHDEHTKLGRMVREVDAHLVPFGHYTATERVRIARAFRAKNLGTQLSDRIADMIHNSRRRRA